MIKPPRLERSWFWSQIEVGDCWLWTGGKSRDRYGKVEYMGTPWTLHRLIWTMLVGDIPEGMEVDHLCKTRLCCNPDHLEVVTHQENMIRMRKSTGRGDERRCHLGHVDEWTRNSRGQYICNGCNRERVRKHRAKEAKPGDAE